MTFPCPFSFSTFSILCVNPVVLFSRFSLYRLSTSLTYWGGVVCLGWRIADGLTIGIEWPVESRKLAGPSGLCFLWVAVRGSKLLACSLIETMGKPYHVLFHTLHGIKRTWCLFSKIVVPRTTL